jgi:hypothetical protein
MISSGRVKNPLSFRGKSTTFITAEILIGPYICGKSLPGV